MSDENILSLSDTARDKIIEIRDQEPGDEEFALLVEVTGIKGAQFAYELSFVPLGDCVPTDHLDRHGDLVIAIPENDVQNLHGASLDLTAQGLAMDNPNSPSPAIGSGPVGELTGPLADQVAEVLANHVNPAIAGHGGAAELVGVEGADVYLRLLGGCQGCGMAAVTLGQGIERILKDAIPEIRQVVDVTDHASGSNPYYEAAKK
jgi:Fe/S biogenesis protein NfuA